MAYRTNKLAIVQEGILKVWKDGNRSYTNTGHRTGTSITSGGCLSLAGEQDSPDGSYESGQALLETLLRSWYIILI